MRVLEASIDIARPVDEVFPYVTDPEHWPVWAGPVTAVRLPESGRLDPGVTFTTVAKLVGKQFETVHRVTEFEPNKLLAYTSESGPVPSTFIWRFESVPDGTRVIETVDGDEARTGGFFKLAFPLVEAVVQRQMVADLATLKDIMENSP